MRQRDTLINALAECLIHYHASIQKVAEPLDDATLDMLIAECRKEAQHTETHNFEMPEWDDIADLLEKEKTWRAVERRAKEHMEQTGEGSYCPACDGTCKGEDAHFAAPRSAAEMLQNAIRNTPLEVHTGPGLDDWKPVPFREPAEPQKTLVLPVNPHIFADLVKWYDGNDLDHRGDELRSKIAWKVARTEPDDIPEVYREAFVKFKALSEEERELILQTFDL